MVGLSRWAYKKLPLTTDPPSVLGTKPLLAPAPLHLESYSLKRQKTTKAVLPYHPPQREVPGARGCTTDANRSKIMATWNATGNSIHRWCFLVYQQNAIQVKKHFRCSTLQFLTTYYLFKTASASHGEMKRKVSAGTPVPILSEVARILFRNVIIGNVSKPLSVRFFKKSHV